ncbi:glycosyl hydrolase family 43 [Dysgonomonas sp. 521]|uniref:glycoside hydrolase family 43 protein n=1 Tax=Dysgonomonas sp. 521 TaxID=2302932 RepID=UPI0013D3B044|nr:glycoside hydrolase family 43 protein [Dysgonomonas sp. 521]NDV93975.1 glycosyl hydrolase family 43 [Dysgonomonas sp. 521]
MNKFYKNCLVFTLLILGFCNCSSKNTIEKEPPIEQVEVFNIKLSDISARDPFILADPQTKMYYLHKSQGNWIQVYKSKDLKMWKDEGESFRKKEDYWGKQSFWAPDEYYYKGKYYLFITSSNEAIKRGSSILVSDNAMNKFEPLVNAPATPADWMSLDASLYVDEKNVPWLIYCHEWIQVTDGEVVAQQLSEDLKTTVGDPVVLFKASDAAWVGPHVSDGKSNYVTDASFIFRMDDGKLALTWSSMDKNGKYCIGVCYSENGVFGPWVHDAEPLNNDNGGHAMLFKDFDNNLMISYHSPNDGPAKVMIKPVKTENGKLKIEY